MNRTEEEEEEEDREDSKEREEGEEEDGGKLDELDMLEEFGDLEKREGGVEDEVGEEEDDDNQDTDGNIGNNSVGKGKYSEVRIIPVEPERQNLVEGGEEDEEEKRIEKNQTQNHTQSQKLQQSTPQSSPRLSPQDQVSFKLVKNAYRHHSWSTTETAHLVALVSKTNLYSEEEIVNLLLSSEIPFSVEVCRTLHLEGIHISEQYMIKIL